MSVLVSHTHTAASPDVIQLIRNIMILPVVRSNFASDNLYFENNNTYEYPSPYTWVARRVIRRIDRDIAKLSRVLQASGVELGEERQDAISFTRWFAAQGVCRSLTLRWGTFEGEIELLMHYYLGNLDPDSAVSGG
ncbi:hypothetical protein [Paenibacillus ginsengarvi]|uniref:Uncharacterized protein n=1 Tax=Paenibacillus ginsengarvi TaxID=400777 RepID=A0A3B0CJP0_9BACL|nr:hypothetical protein [Paenibacillus ginsengarvi]RKN85623.1 hypothetical protein D7M11_08060 [Paenibacillus ginsengarvi]